MDRIAPGVWRPAILECSGVAEPVPSGGGDPITQEGVASMR